MSEDGFLDALLDLAMDPKEKLNAEGDYLQDLDPAAAAAKCEAADNICDHLGVEHVNGNCGRCGVHLETYAEQEARLEADARALWAVRVLDAWAKANGNAPVSVTWCPEDYGSGLRWSCMLGTMIAPPKLQMFGGPTPDAARIAAATALVAADPSLDPDVGRAVPRGT